MKWDARDERVRSDDTLRKYAALSQTFCLYMFCIAPQSYRGAPTLPSDFACLNPAQRAAGKILSGNRNSRAVRSFAIPASISLNRPQGALNYGSKYNAAHWSGQSEKQNFPLI